MAGRWVIDEAVAAAVGSFGPQMVECDAYSGVDDTLALWYVMRFCHVCRLHRLIVPEYEAAEQHRLPTSVSMLFLCVIVAAPAVCMHPIGKTLDQPCPRTA